MLLLLDQNTLLSLWHACSLTFWSALCSQVYLLMLAQPDTSSNGPVEADGRHPLWSDETRTVANLPQYWNVLQRNHGGCSMHDGSAFSTSSALLLGLHRAAMEPSARGFRESFSPFWEGGDERFRGACEQWQTELIGGLELSQREGLLVCPEGTDHSSLLPLLEALVSARAPRRFPPLHLA